MDPNDVEHATVIEFVGVAKFVVPSKVMVVKNPDGLDVCAELVSICDPPAVSVHVTWPPLTGRLFMIAVVAARTTFAVIR